MIDKLIGSDLAALARENHQRIPAFVPPAPRAKAVARVLTWAHVLAVAPAITMLALGGALLAFDCAPFGHYEPFVMPFVVAVASFGGLLIAPAHKPLPRAVLRMRTAWILTGAALLGGMLASMFVDWPGTSTMCSFATSDGLYASACGIASFPIEGPGFIVIGATVAMWVGRRIAVRVKPEWLANRRELEAWSTAALIIGVLVVVIWSKAFDFEDRYWSIVTFRLPDPGIPQHVVANVTGRMWFALTFRPWSYSAISDAQWDLGAAALGVSIVAFLTGVAIARERRLRRGSRWLRLLELPAVVPLCIIIGTANLARATIAEGPRDAGRPFAWAVAGVMLAFTSMLLRRRRRREALS